MVFSSLLFLFRFLIITYLVYYITPKKGKNAVLLLASLIFYGWGEPKYVLIMFFSIFLDYTCGRIIEFHRGRKGWMRVGLLMSVFGNLGLLGFFKYTDFFLKTANSWFGTEIPLLELALPLGISFYTFQTMSYTIGVYRGEFSAEKNIVDFGTFVTLFPQLIAGPIVQYGDVRKELKERSVTLTDLEEGIQTFLFGLGKKVLLANTLGALWEEVQGFGFENISTGLAWLGILAFSLQIYFDFSGYSQMAIGLGRCLGFRFPKNFDLPYISRSITEFWRRWHITLGSWFRDYVYFPMGGSRCSRPRHYLNLFVVWFLTGFWHGADWNFILWGLHFFVLLVIEKTFLKKWLDRHPVIATVYTLFFVVMGWVLFSITDLSQIGLFLSRLFLPSGGVGALYYLRNYALVFAVSVVCSTPLILRIWEKVSRLKWLSALLLLGVGALSVACLVNGSYNPFLYFRF